MPRHDSHTASAAMMRQTKTAASSGTKLPYSLRGTTHLKREPDAATPARSAHIAQITVGLRSAYAPPVRAASVTGSGVNFGQLQRPGAFSRWPRLPVRFRCLLSPSSRCLKYYHILRDTCRAQHAPAPLPHDIAETERWHVSCYVSLTDFDRVMARQGQRRSLWSRVAFGESVYGDPYYGHQR